MTPTNKLRFVKRYETIMLSKDIGERRPVKILQQWWEKRTLDNTIPELIKGGAGEWRDVEVVNE
jgi:hypothetical protein